MTSALSMTPLEFWSTQARLQSALASTVLESASVKTMRESTAIATHNPSAAKTSVVRRLAPSLKGAPCK